MLRWTAFFALGIVTGCTSQLTVITEEIEYIQTSDFTKSPTEVLSETLDTSEEISEIIALEVEEVLIEDLVAEALEAEKAELYEAMVPDSVGVALTVEALVGQINGRPIYANTVLDPIADELAAASEQLSRPEFSASIREALYSETEQMGVVLREGRVYDLVMNDLLLSEALSGMTTQQSYGLISIIGQMRSDLASAQGGSQSQLREDLSTKMGVSVDEFLEFQREKILIDALYRQKIMPKVNVTWRDIQREFGHVVFDDEVVIEPDESRTAAVLMALRTGKSLRDIEAARGTVTLGRIRLPLDDPRIEEVKIAFEDGFTFEEVSQITGTPNGGVWEMFEMGEGGISDIQAGPVLQERLVGLSEGDILEPITFATSINWFAVLDVQQPISLYNRQIQIAVQSALQEVQFRREGDRYVESLWGEGSLKKVKSMADSIANIAIQRFQR
ncbi:MAG: hypothetical protein QGI78_04930 [Phycisphaerales bacterium]|jgi:hypothetical protein|nr:hypothetical protein [Phycisphaerales bacterium]